MPKLHDACQILLSDLSDASLALPPRNRMVAFCLALHSMEEDLAMRRDDAAIISQHLWIVMESLSIEQRHASSDEPDLREDDPDLASLCETAVELGLRLFP